MQNMSTKRFIETESFIKRTIYTMAATVIASSLLLSGCGSSGGSSDPAPLSSGDPDAPVTPTTPETPTTPTTPTDVNSTPTTTPTTTKSDIRTLSYFAGNINVTENSQTFPITIYAFDSNNAPVENGNIAIFYPAENTQADIGSISPLRKVALIDGKAQFTYTGPAKLQSTVDGGIGGVNFIFYDDTNSTQQKTISVTFSPSTTVVKPDLENYQINFTPRDVPAKIETDTPFAIKLTDKNNNDVTTVSSVTITSLSPNVAGLIESNDINKTVRTSLTLTPDSNANFVDSFVHAYKYAGLVPFEISVTFTDSAGKSRTETEVEEVVIYSGEPQSISIIKAESKAGTTAATFEDTYEVHVVDQYGNPINTGEEYFLSFSSVIAPAIDPTGAGATQPFIPSQGHGDFNRLYDLTGAGTISQVTGEGAQFTTSRAGSLANVDAANDVLITWAATEDAYVYKATGYWNIESVAGDTLTLRETYDGVDATKLNYTIGHARRTITCDANDTSGASGDVLAKVDTENSSIKLDEKGVGSFKIVYDAPLVGADIFLAVNVLGANLATSETRRLGGGAKFTLRGIGVELYGIESIQWKGNNGALFYAGSEPISIAGTDGNYRQIYGYADFTSKGDGDHYYAVTELNRTSGASTTYSGSFFQDTNSSELVYFPRIDFDTPGSRFNQLTGCNGEINYFVGIIAEGQTGTVTIDVNSKYYTAELR